MMPSHAGAWSVAALVLVGLAVATTRGDDPKKPPMANPLLEDEPLAFLVRGEKQWVGRIDDNGNFVPDPKWPPLSFGPVSGPPMNYWYATSMNANIIHYEHRS